MAGDDASNAGKKEEAIDHNSPFYLHPSDYTRQMHVTDALNDTNYQDWSQEMLNFLFAKNKTNFVDGTLKKPEEGSPNYMAWMRCDAMIKGWLRTAMEKEIKVSVKYADTAEEIWNDLKERFGKGNAPRAYELKQLLSSMRQDGVSVSAYYTKLRAIWDEMGSALSMPKCSCNGCKCGQGKKLMELRDKERLYEFLLGLDKDFSTIRTQILAMKPTPTLGEAYHLVAEDEHQRIISSGKKSSVEVAAFQAYTKRDGVSTGQAKMGQKGSRKSANDKIEHCDFCGKDGHVKEGCFKRIGYPEWWPGKGKTQPGKPRVALVENEASAVPGLSTEQYQQFLNLFREKNSTLQGGTTPVANMAGRWSEGLELEEIDWDG